MPRLRSPRGVVVNVDDATAAGLIGYEPVALEPVEASEPAKKPAKKAARKTEK